MTALPTTGIPAVDAELERRGPFANANEAEAAAAKLLAVWRALYPSSSGVCSTSRHSAELSGGKSQMGDVVSFPTSLLDDYDLLEDLARFSEGVLTQDAVKKRHRLPDSVWQQLGENDALVEKVENLKLQRIRSGLARREKSQLLAMKSPEVLSGIMLDPAANPKHRIDSAVVLDRFSANGPEKAPADDSRFIITINLNSDGSDHVEHYNKSITINADDTPPELIPFSSFKSED
jgi:hypothetical protein